MGSPDFESKSRENPKERYFLALRFNSPHSPIKVIPLLFAIRKMYVAYWLASQGRATDAQVYAATWDSRFEREAGIRVEQNGLAQEPANGENSGQYMLSFPPTHNPKVILQVKERLDEMFRSNDFS